MFSIFVSWQEAIGPYCILPFMGMSAFFFVFFFFLQPETAGRLAKKQAEISVEVLEEKVIIV